MRLRVGGGPTSHLAFSAQINPEGSLPPRNSLGPTQGEGETHTQLHLPPTHHSPGLAGTSHTSLNTGAAAAETQDS